MDALMLTPWAALVRPNLPRLLWLMLGYLSWSSLFLYALEQASGLAAMQIGLLPTALGTAIMALPCLPVIVLTWYSVVKRRWLRDPELRARVESHGMYAALPWWQWPLINLTVTLLMTCVTHPLWIEVIGLLDLWGSASPDFYRLPNSLTVGGFGQAVALAFDMIFVRQQHERMRAATAQRQLAQAQLQRLQAQMEPHMLFNTLANLHALIETEPTKAQDMLAHLIDYLRANLSASRHGQVSLTDEMKHVQDYLALMQVRMGDRLRVRLNVPNDMGDVTLPPMLIQPLVENAIKHGLDPLPIGGELHISAQRQGQVMTITVQDTGAGLHTMLPTAAVQSGFGLDCVRARLHTCYGEQARFSITTAPLGGTIATLQLPTHLPVMPHTEPHTA
jgi:two-component sensor histidine kinase